MATPFFSIITPTYNRLELLRETLASAWTQEYTDYELIVIDDGSTDGTRQWLDTLGDRVQVLRQENGGAGRARNLGLAHARGDYVAFLDSDDLWFPWTLATYAQVIAEQNSPSFLTAAVTRFDHPDVPTDVVRGPIRVKVFPDYFASGDEWRWYGMSSFIVKRECLTTVGGFSTEPINNEDTELSIRLGTCPSFVHIQSPVTMAYREHAGGIRHVTRKSAAGALHLLKQDSAGQYPGGQDRAWERWRIMGRHLRPCAMQCVKEGMWSEGWELYRAMWWRNARAGRWRFLLGFPAVAVANALKRSATL